MTKVQVVYIDNIEKALKKYTSDGFKLMSINQSARVEMRFEMWHPEKGRLSLARQFWDELHPETIGMTVGGLPEPAEEWCTESSREFNSYYKRLLALGLVPKYDSAKLKELGSVNFINSRITLQRPDVGWWE